MVRFRADYDESGALATTFPEDITVTWNSGTNTLSAGGTSLLNVSNLTIRYFDSSGAELTPPMGGWDVSTTAAHGAVLASIARIRLQIQMQSRYRNPADNQFIQETLTSDITVRNQNTTL